MARILDNDLLGDEEYVERTLRPQYFKEYIGQDKVKDQLKIFIEAAKLRDEALDHTLLFGPPGLGKTTMAFVIANEMGVNLKQTSGPAIEKAGDLVAILNDLEPGDILFIDEIHRMPMAVEEVLYSAMEDYYIDIMIGAGETSRSVHLELPPFTLVGATTRAGMLSNPLRARFGINGHMEYYELPDLKEIIERTSEIFDMTITPEAALELARRSRGTPRIANRLLKRVRDYAQIMGDGIIDDKIADKALTMLDVDHEGLDYVDQKILRTMIEMYGGGPVGLGTLSVNIAEERETVEDMYEPYLIQKGFIMRTRTGRVCTSIVWGRLLIAVLVTWFLNTPSSVRHLQFLEERWSARALSPLWDKGYRGLHCSADSTFFSQSRAFSGLYRADEKKDWQSKWPPLEVRFFKIEKQIRFEKGI